MQIATLEDIEKIEQVPLSDRLGKIDTSYAVFAHGAREMPTKTALMFVGTAADEEPPIQYSYEDLFSRINQTANFLNDLGMGSSDVVSLIMPNLPETHFFLWGGEAAGIVNPINPFLEVAHIVGITKAAGTKILVAPGPMPGSEMWEKAVQVLQQCPSIEALVQVGGLPQDGEKIIHYNPVVGTYTATSLDSGRVIKPGDTASLFHTGGTTGVPKLARHTHYNEVADALMTSLVGATDQDSVGLCGLPLFHVNAAIVTGLSCFLQQATVLLATPGGYRTPDVIGNFWKLIERYRVTFFSGVPTLYASLLNVPIGACDVSSLRYAICGAAPMPRETIRRFESATGLSILEGYGLTEGTCVSACNPRAGERRAGSVGFRLPYQDMKSVQLDEGGHYLRDSDVNEIGALVIRGPNVFPGYLQEDANAHIWVDGDWLNTGDRGRQDEDGYFWLTGRTKELIIRGGHNIDPAIIENALARHEAVAQVAAVGQPDPYAGELPVAYVVLKPGIGEIKSDLLEFSRQNIAERAAIPKEIYFLENLPLTAVGKPFKPALRLDATKRECIKALAGISGLDTIDVQAHPVHGSMVILSLKPGASGEDREKIGTILGAYAFRYEIIG
ncbi:acyl-CoA synthetase [Emcibacter nanhaiensis]|uniref:acyl-CoA synthetase n=1 Tax=Emcibacter nanhaiensis TaxID=1505037 RepID=UPI0015E42DC2|nr:acyl-CoA synthetase [Emcibacter nanhaiensis]